MSPAPASPAAPPCPVPWWFRVVRALLNLLLLGLLALQTFVLVLVATEKHLALPGFLRELIEARLQAEGVSVRFTEMELTLSGNLLLHQPQIFLTGASEPVAEAELLDVEPNWFALVWSRVFSLSRLRLDAARFYCPPEVSPSGARTTLVSGLDILLTNQGANWWKLDYFRAQVLNTRLLAQGTMILAAPETAAPAPARPAPAAPAPSFAAQYRQYARQAVELQATFDKMKNPVIILRLEAREPNITQLQLFALGDAAVDVVPGLTLGRHWSRMTAEWNGRELHATTRAVAWVETAQFFEDLSGVNNPVSAPRQILSGGPIWALAELATGVEGLFGRPTQVWFSVCPVSVYGFPFDSMGARWDLRAWPKLQFQAYAAQAKNWLKASGVTDYEQHSMELAFDASVDPAVVLKAARLNPPPALRALKFARPPHVRGQLQLGSGFTAEGLNFELEAGGTQFAPLPVRAPPPDAPPFRPINLYALTASGTLTPDRLDVRETTMWNDTWTVEGSYSQDLRTDQFRILGRGSIDPGVLDPYIVGDWWMPLWKFIVPGKNWPHPDLDYQGFWGPDSNEDIMNSLFCSVRLAGASARGVFVEDLSVRVYQRLDVTAVFGLRATVPEGGALTGTLLWMMKPPYQHLYEQRYLLTSTLPLNSAAALVGHDIVELVRPLNFSAPPLVRVDQRVGGSASPEYHVTATDLQVDQDLPFHAYGIPLDSLHGRAHLYQGFTDIPELNVGIAGSTAEARATLTDLGDDTELAFNVTLAGARHTAFLSALRQFNATGAVTSPDATTGAGNPLSDDARAGKLDLSLGSRVLLGRGETFAAGGHAHIYEAKLGQLHLFGVLSSVLSNTILPLGSLQLDAAESDFQIANNYARFPNVRVTGPSARIVAGGLYHFPDDQLDFRAVLFPLGQWKMPVVKQFIDMFSVMNNAFTVRLSGSLASPKWALGMDPGRIFDAQNIKTPPIPGYPAYADGSPILPSLPFPPPALPAAPKAATPPPAPPTVLGSPHYQ